MDKLREKKEKITTILKSNRKNKRDSTFIL